MFKLRIVKLNQAFIKKNYGLIYMLYNYYTTRGYNCNSFLLLKIYEDRVKQISNRLSRIIGQLQAIKRMTEKKRECGEILIQISAARSALESASKIILQDHINCYIHDAVERNDEGAINDLNNLLSKFIY
jgi:CsoR family transcriptional regulator, copper-sensing transcriptional repressor